MLGDVSDPQQIWCVASEHPLEKVSGDWHLVTLSWTSVARQGFWAKHDIVVTLIKRDGNPVWSHHSLTWVSPRGHSVACANNGHRMFAEHG